MAGMRLQTMLEAGLASSGLSQGQYSVLLSVEEGSPAYASRIAERLDRSLPTVTKLIDKLRARGLLEPTGGGGDARRRGYVLTDAARRLLSELAPGYGEAMRAACADLSDAEKALLSSLLSKLRLGRAVSPFNEGPSYKSKCEMLKGLCNSGTAYDVDCAMAFLDDKVDVPTTKIVDYFLGTVESPDGEARIRHHLLNGTPIQRNYCALNRARRNDWEAVNEAYRKGLIDYAQAYSR